MELWYDLDALPSPVLLFESTHDGIGVKYVNQAFRKTLGYELANLPTEIAQAAGINVKLTCQNSSEKWFDIITTDHIKIFREIENPDKAMIELLDNNEHLIELQNMARIGSWELDLATNNITWTQSIYDIHGENPAYQPTLESFFSSHREEDRDILHTTLQHAIESGEKQHIIHSFCKEDGSVVELELIGRALYDEEKRPIKVIGISRDITHIKMMEGELEQHKSELQRIAHHDTLTDLPNRTLFKDRLEHAISKAKHNGNSFALLFIDLDQFKQINDSLGHTVGDEVLKDIASKLSRTIGEEGTLARLGGDEFAVIVEDIRGSDEVADLAQTLIDLTAEPIEIDEHTFFISSSIGITVYPTDSDNLHDLLMFADNAMYQAKEGGRKDYCFFSQDMTEKAYERIELESALRQAIDNREFIVYYQPKFDVRDDTIVGLEALVRWESPTKGMVSPGKFIPLAEETGLIIELDRIVMEEVMRQSATWYGMGLKPGRVSLNLSMKQLKSEDFISVLKSNIQTYQCDPNWLELEITEGQVMLDPEQSISKLKEISALGIKISIDDFGTGYSSLAYLKRLPLDKLKIDQSFVRDLPENDDDIAIARAVIALAKSLRMQVIAEGVEEESQKEFLLDNECYHLQGYLYSRPLPAHDMEKMLTLKYLY
jgi:diguanylate cyclase (GGDEF)-like protein/PAS domain S-box-containing protein